MLRGGATALATLALLATGGGAAAAQVPPPPNAPPGGELPSPPPPSDAPSHDPEVITDPPPGSAPEPAAPKPPQGPESPEQAGPVPPVRAVELVDRDADLRGNRLAIGIRCRDAGAAILRHKKRKVSRTSFTCTDFAATVSFKLRARDVKSLRRAGRTRLTARFRVGTARVRLTVVARSARVVASVAASKAWERADVACGSRFGAYPGLSIDAGYASSFDGRDDWMAYRYWIYTPSIPAPELRWTAYGWSSWHQAPSLGAVWAGGQDHFGLRAGGGAWVYVVVEKHWHYAQHSEYVSPRVRSELGGFVLPGGWCWWTD
jgi:hypothetical protein